MLGGYISPVNDGYKKAGLVAAVHRVAMCELGAQDSDVVMIDSWEARQCEYQRTRPVLTHVSSQINQCLARAREQNCQMPQIKVGILQSRFSNGICHRACV